MLVMRDVIRCQTALEHTVLEDFDGAYEDNENFSVSFSGIFCLVVSPLVSPQALITGAAQSGPQRRNAGNQGSLEGCESHLRCHP